MIGYVTKEIGSKTLMYASDYPHWDMSWPESATILWNRDDISIEVKKDLLLNNAKRFYSI
jgi:predicted TIM-barrel fold metal-dependent hydrolase